MYTISKIFHFSASHQLLGLPDTHPCVRLHGHNYKIEVELQSQTLDSHGFVCDYLDLVILKNYIDDNLDHRHLNDVLGNDNVTAEKIAKHLYDFCKKHWEQTSAIRVYETDKTCAEYRK